MPLALALIVFGLALVVIEVYLIPGFNVLGVLGVLLAGAGVGYAFVELGPAAGLATLAGTLVAGGGLFYGLWRSGAWNRFILGDTLRRDPGAAEAEHDTRARLLGQTGTALSPLRPTGVVEIEGERVEVMTEGAFVAAGSRVRVVAMDRRRYLVRLAEEGAAEPVPPGPAPRA